MSTSQLTTVLDRQLLIQLGDRLRRLRKAQGLSTVDMAARVGITRNTLRVPSRVIMSPSAAGRED